MLNEDYIVHVVVKENYNMYKEVFFHDLEKKNKQIVSLIYEVAQYKYKKFILVLNTKEEIVKLRVFSTGENSKRFVDVICSFEFILTTDFFVICNVVNDSVQKAIELTIESMEVKK